MSVSSPSTYLQQTTRTTMSAYPAADGKGKWHAALVVTGVSYCGSNRSQVVLDTNASPILAGVDAERVHPFVCKRCLSYWRADVKGQ